VILGIYKKLQRQALREFSDIVEDAEVVISESGRPKKLRIYLIEGTFIDIWFSSVTKSYSYHWERKEIYGSLYRHDNAPHSRWSNVSTFPAHFHNGSEENVVESKLSKAPEKAVSAFLSFCRDKLSEGKA